VDIAEGWKDVKDYMKDRTANPLFVSFAVAWLIANWRVVVVLLSADDVATKFRLFETEVWAAFPKYGFHSFWLPLLIAVLYTFVWPWPERKMYAYLRGQQNRRKAAKIKADGEEPISKEEAAEIHAMVLSARADVANKEDELRHTRENLREARKQIDEAQATSQTFADQVESLNASKVELTKKLEDALQRASVRQFEDSVLSRVITPLRGRVDGMPLFELAIASGLSQATIQQMFENFPGLFTTIIGNGRPAQRAGRIALSETGINLAAMFPPTAGNAEIATRSP